MARPATGLPAKCLLGNKPLIRGPHAQAVPDCLPWGREPGQREKCHPPGCAASAPGLSYADSTAGHQPGQSPAHTCYCPDLSQQPCEVGTVSPCFTDRETEAPRGNLPTLTANLDPNPGSPSSIPHSFFSFFFSVPFCFLPLSPLTPLFLLFPFFLSFFL